MTHDPDTLASAYLDGELTDDERRAAEADPAVMAEVEQMRSLRADLADVASPSVAAREAAVSAAMAAYHDQFDAPVTSAPRSEPSEHIAAVVPMWRRLASPQWLGAAAAATVLVVAVGVVAGRTGDGSDDSGPIEVTADAEAELEASGRIAESESVDGPFAAEEDADMALAGDDMGEAEEPADEPADESALEEEDMAAPESGFDESLDDADAPADSDMAEDESDMSEDDSAETAVAGDAATGDSGFGDIAPLDDPSAHFELDVPIVGPLQLRSAAWYLLTQRAEGRLGPTPEYRCEFFNVLGEALLDVGGETVEVLLEIDETDRLVYAVERDGCLVVTAVDLDQF